MAASEEEPQEPRALEEPLMVFSNLGRTVDGAGLAYRSVDCSNKRINAIKAIEPYSHLHHIDLSHNVIQDVAPLKNLKLVLKLNLSYNEIKDVKAWDPGEEAEEVFPHLLELDLSFNLLRALPALPMKALRTARFKRNDIATCQELTGHPTVEHFDMSENRLQNLAGFTAMPALRKLDISGQLQPLPPEPEGGKKGKKKEVEEPPAEDMGPPGLTTMEGLTEMPELKELDMSKNRLANLVFPWQDFPVLTKLDISQNSLPDVKLLEALRQAPKLTSLKVHGNPFVAAVDAAVAAAAAATTESAAGEDTEDAADTVEKADVKCDVRTEVLICHWRLADIDSEAVKPEELERARIENVRRLTAEKARLQAEADKAAAEEGAGE
eukprot:TRINITY_DN19412_c0_g1_i1.p1 TRINITY_DN19412_c0_g1~~TRINITY_DN19412_c0_g1_i1.p1  ORF type:complete len:408 (-),score=93.51 TRINITY_DN19412_c0_g1_i1:167-1309(-)